MSSHRKRTRYFSRATKPRLALLRGLQVSLVEHERITTTVERAKETRRLIEKAITLGKKGDVATTRLLMSRLPNKEVVSKIVTDLAVRFKDRPGGYTRIIKVGRRPGDTAEMAFLEFVDYDWKKAAGADEGKEAKKDGEKSTVKAASKAKKAVASAAAAKKKTAKKSQKKARAAARA